MPSKVLLIDDSVTIHRVIDLSIDLDKFEVVKVFSKGEASQKLTSSKFSYILLDNKLEHVHIFDYIKELKEGYSDTKIILLVGAFDKFTEQDLKHSMADDFLVKPFDSQSLNMKLSNIKVDIPEFINNVETDVVIDEATATIDEVITDDIDKLLNDVEAITSDDILDVDINATTTTDSNVDINIDLANEKIAEPTLDEIDNIILDAKEIDETFDNIKSNDKLDISDIPEFADKKIDITDKFDISKFNVDDAIGGIIDNWDSSGDEKVKKTTADAEIDINAEFDFNDVADDIDVDGSEDILKINDEEIFTDSIKIIEDAKVDQSEFDKIAEGLDIDFIEDEAMLKKEDAEKKDKILKSGLSYLELEDDINNIDKPSKLSATIDSSNDQTIHRELAGSVLYDEVIKPTLSDVIDIATTPITKNKSLLVDEIEEKITEKSNDIITKKILKDSNLKNELSAVIENTISKEFLEDKINDVLAKSLKQAIEELIPRLAEKYIMEEINRLKEDE